MNVLGDIANRTNGDVYIGVVGPVRTGKSTFIKRFMDVMVLPNMKNSYEKERLNDELPQSAYGRTIMTTEPKFIPNDAAKIDFKDSGTVNIKMIDCVGYVVDEALGYQEDGLPRMVKTPWSEKEIPFIEAAEIGTKRVINEHSTIGIVITTDGSITDIERSCYIEAERRVVRELKELHKPFIMILNSYDPKSQGAIKLCDQLAKDYEVPVVCANCAELNEDDIASILQTVLYEFPISQVSFSLPNWIKSLEKEHKIKKSILSVVKDMMNQVISIRDVTEKCDILSKCEYLKEVSINSINPGEGGVDINIKVDDGLFYSIISESTGLDITSDYDLMSTITELSKTKSKYDKLEYALNEVKEKGYGIVSPSIDELTLEEPEIVRQGNKYGVSLRASAPSIHNEGIKQKCKYRNKNLQYRSIAYACKQLICKPIILIPFPIPLLNTHRFGSAYRKYPLAYPCKYLIYRINPKPLLVLYSFF